jgi:hypothetical protein
MRLLLWEGRVLFRERPVTSTLQAPEVIGLLERAYADYYLQVAGPALGGRARNWCVRYTRFRTPPPPWR